jgi:hypothetical protein
VLTGFHWVPLDSTALQPIPPLRNQSTETSRSAYVLFLAAATLQNAVAREWALLPQQEVVALREYIVEYVSRKRSR